MLYVDQLPHLFLPSSVKSHSMSNKVKVPWWPSQIFVKLCDCDSCPMTWKSWKFELLTIYHSQDIVIQRSNPFPKIGPHINFLFLKPFSESNNSFKYCHIKLVFSEVIWDQAYFTKKQKIGFIYKLLTEIVNFSIENWSIRNMRFWGY